MLLLFELIVESSRFTKALESLLVTEPVTLPLQCPVCRRPVTVRFSPWTAESPRQPQTWRCPHCHAENAAELPGKLEWVLARQDNDQKK